MAQPHVSYIRPPATHGLQLGAVSLDWFVKNADTFLEYLHFYLKLNRQKADSVVFNRIIKTARLLLFKR